MFQYNFRNTIAKPIVLESFYSNYIVNNLESIQQALRVQDQALIIVK